MANNRGDPPLGRVGRKGLSEQRIFKIKPYKAGGKHPSQKGKKICKDSNVGKYLRCFAKKLTEH